MHRDANCNALTGQLPSYEKNNLFLLLSLVKLSDTKTLNKQLLTLPIRLEDVYVLCELHTLCLLSLLRQQFLSPTFEALSV